MEITEQYVRRRIEIKAFHVRGEGSEIGGQGKGLKKGSHSRHSPSGRPGKSRHGELLISAEPLYTD